jgi:hypothetical protein
MCGVKSRKPSGSNQVRQIANTLELSDFTSGESGVELTLHLRDQIDGDEGVSLLRIDGR